MMPNDVVVTSQVKQKVWGATAGSAVGSAVAIILIWLVTKAGIVMPDNVQAAITTLITLIFTGGAGYMTPPGATETNVIENGKTKSAIMKAP